MRVRIGVDQGEGGKARGRKGKGGEGGRREEVRREESETLALWKLCSLRLLFVAFGLSSLVNKKIRLCAILIGLKKQNKKKEKYGTGGEKEVYEGKEKRSKPVREHG